MKRLLFKLEHSPVSLPDLARAASHILAFLEARRRPACVIGGVAVSRWGEPRATQDVDRIRYWGRQFADLKEDPDLLRPFEDALKKATQTQC